jgi:hypothetical protein
MQIPKEQILSMIESRMGGDQAQQAAQQLPDQVDHEQHAGLLSQFGIDPHEIASQFGGGGGGGLAGGLTGGGGGGQAGSGQGGGDPQGGQFGGGGGQGEQFASGGDPQGGDQFGGGGTQDEQQSN